MNQREFAGEVREASFICKYCGVENFAVVDPSQGETQQYVEDCQTCCRPNVLTVTYDQFSKSYHIDSRLEH